MTAIRVPRPSSQSPFAFAGREAVIAALACVAYVGSTIKFQSRDPLSTQTGFQAALEISLMMLSLGLAAVITSPRTLRPHLTPTVIGLSLFACFAMLSSVFSFWPELSLIKGALLLTAIAIAALLCAARPPHQVLAAVYWCVLAAMVIGTCAKLVSSQPLFDADEYSGRMRFTLFALHWGSLADYVAYTFLLGRLLPRRPHWSCQGFLLAANLAAGARASTGSLIAILAIGWLWNQNRVTAKGVSMAAFGVAGVALLTLVAVNQSVSVSSIPYERFYGDKVTLDEIVTLNNRTGLWTASLPLVPGALLFGYGVEGMRAALLQEFDWAGHSHNAYLELLFASGLPGMVSFMVGWIAAVVVAWRVPKPLRVAVISLHAYMFLCGLTDPNLMLLQYFPIFVIVCLDALVRAEAPEPAAVPVRVGTGPLFDGPLALSLPRRSV